MDSDSGPRPRPDGIGSGAGAGAAVAREGITRRGGKLYYVVVSPAAMVGSAFQMEPSQPEDSVGGTGTPRRS